MENSWIESYLDALLSHGLSTEHIIARQRDGFSDLIDAEKNVTAKYYVQQILDMDEAALWQAWKRVSSGRSIDDKDARLEFLVWRVWFLKQKRHRVLTEEDARLKEEAPDETVLSQSSTDDEEADLTESVEVENLTQRFSFLSSENEVFTSTVVESLETRVDKLYVILISLHGLIRGQGMELGRDADTGGQV